MKSLRFLLNLVQNQSFIQSFHLSEPSPNDSCGHKTVFVTQYLDSRPSIYLKLQARLSLNILALPME